jgi:hypothetical protein
MNVKRKKRFNILCSITLVVILVSWFLAILWIIGIALAVALWVAAAEIVPQSFGPVYFAFPFVTAIVVGLFVRTFKK